MREAPAYVEHDISHGEDAISYGNRAISYGNRTISYGKRAISFGNRAISYVTVAATSFSFILAYFGVQKPLSSVLRFSVLFSIDTLKFSTMKPTSENSSLLLALNLN